MPLPFSFHLLLQRKRLPVVCLKRGNRITIKNLPKTADEAVKLFKSYGG